MIPFILAFALLAPIALSAQDLPAPVQAVVDDARADCESFEAGEFAAEGSAVQQIDLTGSGEGWIVDTGKMSCSSAASMYCGSGGCGLSMVVGDSVTERIAARWQVMTFFSAPVVLLNVHGSLCGGINPTPCVEALVWDSEAGQFSSIAAQVQ